MRKKSARAKEADADLPSEGTSRPTGSRTSASPTPRTARQGGVQKQPVSAAEQREAVRVLFDHRGAGSVGAGAVDAATDSGSLPVRGGACQSLFHSLREGKVPLAGPTLSPFKGPPAVDRDPVIPTPLPAPEVPPPLAGEDARHHPIPMGSTQSPVASVPGPGVPGTTSTPPYVTQPGCHRLRKHARHAHSWLSEPHTAGPGGASLGAALMEGLGESEVTPKSKQINSLKVQLAEEQRRHSLITRLSEKVVAENEEMRTNMEAMKKTANAKETEIASLRAACGVARTLAGDLGDEDNGGRGKRRKTSAAERKAQVDALRSAVCSAAERTNSPVARLKREVCN